MITLYTQLTSLEKKSDESVTDYVLRAETLAAALNNAGENISDSLLSALVLKGLPFIYKPFVVFITQSQDTYTFSELKLKLRSFEENEKACYNNHSSRNNGNNNMVMQFSNDKCDV